MTSCASINCYMSGTPSRRYIEGLTPENRGISDWEKTLTATPENTLLSNNGKLPIHWLANGVGHHDNAVSALWALRDLMLKDTLMVSRTLEFSQLWCVRFHFVPFFYQMFSLRDHSNVAYCFLETGYPTPS